MADRKFTIYFEDIDISTRLKNALCRIGITTLNEVETMSKEDKDKLTNVGIAGREELFSLISSSDALFGAFEERRIRCESLSSELSGISIEEINISTRSKNLLWKHNITTLSELILMTKHDVSMITNYGYTTYNDIVSAIDRIVENGINSLKTNNATIDYDADEPKDAIKGFDYKIIDLLTDKYYFEPVVMAKWFNVGRQSIYNVLNNKPSKRYARWTGFVLSPYEYSILDDMTCNTILNYRNEDVDCYIYNDRRSDLAVIFVYSNIIKCFFLRELPEKLQDSIVSKKMNVYSESEIKGDSNGRIIKFLKKPYFAPYDSIKFRSNAKTRSMSPEEYSLFFSGYPLKNNQADDQRIIQFLKDNMLDGQVYISSDPHNQWLRTVAYRNGFGITDFIKFYGFEPYHGERSNNNTKEKHVEALKKHIVRDNIVYFPAASRTYNIISAYCQNNHLNIDDYVESLGFKRTLQKPKQEYDEGEPDMQIRSVGGNAEDKIFAKYPLIGSKIFSDKEITIINDSAAKCLEHVIKDPQTKLTLQAEMRITLAVINYAKNWKSEENAKFWEYIAFQFGYRSKEESKVCKILQNSLENALKKNNRLFIENENGRCFKSTAVVHALTPKKSWMALFDFLFDFYKNNLNWEIIPGDPIFPKMVDWLRSKIAVDSADDSELSISTGIYSFQEGIKKLILLRPVYAGKLFERMTTRIDSLIRSNSTPASQYEDILCDEWFEEKIKSLAQSHSENSRKTRHDSNVATSYEKIRAKYILCNENEVIISIPDIRLQDSTVDDVVLFVKYNDIDICRQKMSWYGNELGKTLNGVSISLPKYQSDDNEIRVRIVIQSSDDIIYDSGTTLYRKYILFSGTVETSLNKSANVNYSIVYPGTLALSSQGVDITHIDDFRNFGLKADFLQLHNDFYIALEDIIIGFENMRSTDLKVIIPPESLRLPYIDMDQSECRLAYKDSTCKLIFNSDDLLQQYILLINSDMANISDLSNETNNLIYTLPLSDIGEKCHIQIINISNNRLVFDKTFFTIEKAEISFDRDYYFSDEDYEDASCYVQIDDFTDNIYFDKIDADVSIPYKNGELHIPIPKIVLSETTGKWLESIGGYWSISDIPQESFIRTSIPEKVSICFHLGDAKIPYDDNGMISIGNYLYSVGETTKSQLLKMTVFGSNHRSEYILGTVFFKPGFINEPHFYYEKDYLHWDHGGRFIGSSGQKLTLHLQDDRDNEYSIDFCETNDDIVLPDYIIEGSYQFELSAITGGMFKKTKELLNSGELFIGDENKLRFKDKNIIIESVSDEDNTESAHIKITNCFIDNIEFIGIEDTSEGVCPVYNGIMYGYDNWGNRHDFSFEEHTNSQGVRKIAINPVRIIFINDRTLCVTDKDGDGLYYFSFYDKYKEKTFFVLTDRECTPAYKNRYHTADLYFFNTERKKHV